MQPLGSESITDPSLLLRVAPPLPQTSVLTLMVVTTWDVPYSFGEALRLGHSMAGSHVPHQGLRRPKSSAQQLSSCRLYAGCRVAHRQALSTLFQEIWAASRFGSV
jgi:hypothetical protein